MRFSRQRHDLNPGEHRGYVGKHQARRRGVAVLLRGGVAGLVAVLVLAMVAVATLIVLFSRPPSPRDSVAPQTQPAQTSPPSPPQPSQRSASTLIAVPTFRGGVRGWRAFSGSLFSSGHVDQPTAPFARVQQDTSRPPVRDPASGATMVGISTPVLASAQPGTQMHASVRVRATKPGITVVVRLSEWQRSRRVDGGDGRLILPDTGWRQVSADHRALGPGTSIDLEIFALALGPDEALYVDRPVVTSP
jgi:hypothetical protein